VTDHFWLGMAVVFLAGLLNGSFALPMKYVRNWKWENNWLVYTAFALLISPALVAARSVPHLLSVYRGLPASALAAPLIFGFLWGIAETTFGLGISAVGMALAFSVAAGMSSLLGSFIPLVVLNPAGLLQPRGILLLASFPILLVSLVLYSMAGRRREKEQAAGAKTVTNGVAMSFATGLAICIFTGLLAPCINLGFAFSGQVQRAAITQGAVPSAATYAAWTLELSAGFIPNLIYCSWLLFRNRTWSFFVKPGSTRETGLAIAMAALWLSGTLGYGVGSTMLGRYGTSLGFALYSSAFLLASTSLGIATGEWQATSRRTMRMLMAAVAAMLGSVLVLSLGGLF
jgi:L-rhamnose-H+ transport protein